MERQDTKITRKMYPKCRLSFKNAWNRVLEGIGLLAPIPLLRYPCPPLCFC